MFLKYNTRWYKRVSWLSAVAEGVLLFRRCSNNAFVVSEKSSGGKGDFVEESAISDNVPWCCHYSSFPSGLSYLSVLNH